MSSGWKKHNLVTGRELSPNDPQNAHVFGTAAWTKKNEQGRIKNNKGQILYDPTTAVQKNNTSALRIKAPLNVLEPNLPLMANNVSVDTPNVLSPKQLKAKNNTAKNNTSKLRIKAPLNALEPNFPLMANNVSVATPTLSPPKQLKAKNNLSNKTRKNMSQKQIYGEESRVPITASFQDPYTPVLVSERTKATNRWARNASQPTGWRNRKKNINASQYVGLNESRGTKSPATFPPSGNNLANTNGLGGNNNSKSNCSTNVTNANGQYNPNPLWDEEHPGSNRNPLTQNLKCRTGVYHNTKLSPKNGVMITPRPLQRRPFYANLAVGTRKGSLGRTVQNTMRIFGRSPENIKNRYKFESQRLKDEDNDKWLKNQEAQQAAAAAKKASEEAEAKKKANATQLYLTSKARQQNLQSAAAELRRKADEEARKLEEQSEGARYIKQAAKADVPEKKPWYRIFGGKSRKNRSRKSRKSRKSRNSRKNRR